MSAANAMATCQPAALPKLNKPKAVAAMSPVAASPTPLTNCCVWIFFNRCLRYFAARNAVRNGIINMPIVPMTAPGTPAM